jgi:hypothetical protein
VYRIELGAKIYGAELGITSPPRCPFGPAQHLPRRQSLWRRAKGPKMTLKFSRVQTWYCFRWRVKMQKIRMLVRGVMPSLSWIFTFTLLMVTHISTSRGYDKQGAGKKTLTRTRNRTQILFGNFGLQLIKFELILGNSDITIGYPKYLNYPNLYLYRCWLSICAYIIMFKCVWTCDCRLLVFFYIIIHNMFFYYFDRVHNRTFWVV